MSLVDWDVTHRHTEDESEDEEESELKGNEGKQLREDIGEDNE